MGLLDRRRLQNDVMNRSVDDILTFGVDDHENLTEIIYQQPVEKHPIHRFFSRAARINAAGIHYRLGRPHNILSFNGRFESYELKRPPNPDYLMAADIPYPVGETDDYGSGMSFAWTPIGYMIFHDRQNKKDCLFSKIYRDASNELSAEVWSRYLRIGLMFPNPMAEESLIAKITRVLICTDPPADLLPELMFGERIYGEEPDVAFSLIDAAVDFQDRWNRGEWFDGVNPQRSNTALHVLLGL